MRSFAARIAGAALCVLAVGAAARQDRPPQTPPIFRGGIDIVQVDVSVLDKKRKPVRGLTAADFTVLENGKPQKIIAVSEVVLADEVASPPVWARAAPPDVASNDVEGKRIFAIVIASNLWQWRPPAAGMGALSRTPQVPRVDAVLEVVEGIVGRLVPGDVACLIVGGNSLRGQPCTSDLSRMAEAVDALRPGRPEPPLPTTLDNLPSRFNRRYAMLRDLAEYLGAVPQRRKAIFYIGQGGSVPRREPELSEFLELLWHAQRANVNIYTINPSTLFADELGRGTLTRTEVLYALAHNTGGVAIVDSRTLDARLDEVFVENGSYYIVGYQTTNPKLDGKYRRLDVKVNRRDVEVRSRNLLYRPKLQRVDGSANADAPSAELDRSLAGFLPNLDVTFDVVAMPFAQPGRADASVALAIGLTEPVPAGATRIAQRMDIEATAYGERGSIVGRVRTNARVDAAPGAENRIQYDILSGLDLTPGHYSLRVVAHNAETDKLGVINFDVTVPDFAGQVVSMSGVAISTVSVQPVLSFGKPFVSLPVVPTARRAFLSSDEVSAFARVYQGGTGPLQAATLRAQILNAAGTAVFDATETLPLDRFDALRAVDYRLVLPLRALESGPYLLTLQAAVGARQAPQRDVRFVIR